MGHISEVAPGRILEAERIRKIAGFGNPEVFPADIIER